MKRSFITFGLYLAVIGLLGSCNKQAVQVYVSPAGSDAGPGSKAAPLKSLKAARDAVRIIKKAQPETPVLVHIHGGMYELEEPVIFSQQDGGSEKAPVIYQAVKGEEPIFTGGRALKNWQKLTDAAKLKLLAPEVKGKIYMTDVQALGITDLDDPIATGKRPELFCNGEGQTLARWPDSGFTRAGLAKGGTALPPTYIKKQGTVEGVFEYTDLRINRWAGDANACLAGYWYWDWSDEYQKVAAIDTVKKIISIRKPYHGYGYRDSLRYSGLNLFCEMDQPGEWYLDRQQGQLYWYPPEAVDPQSAKVTLSVFNSPYMVEMNDCSLLVLQGLSFQEGRGSAILIRGGHHCLLADCRVERFGQDGIHIEEGTDHGLSGCYLRTFGCSGIKLKGGDRKMLLPANHFVEHTVVEHFSLFQRTYEPAVHLDGCGMRINHNRFRFSSSSAMRLEGNDFTIEYNQISRVVNESDDQGGLDIFYNPSYRGNLIRYNHWSDISGGTLHGAAGVRLDDMISGVTIYGNIFSRCGTRHFGGVQIHGGKDNVVENNLFYQCFAAVSFSSWGEERWLKQLDSPVIEKKIYQDVDIRSAVYQNKYPDLKDIRLFPDRNRIKNNLLVDCAHRFLRETDKAVLENNTSIPANGNTMEAFCSAKTTKQYGLQPIPFHEIGPKKNRWIQRIDPEKND